MNVAYNHQNSFGSTPFDNQPSNSMGGNGFNQNFGQSVNFNSSNGGDYQFTSFKSMGGDPNLNSQPRPVVPAKTMANANPFALHPQQQGFPAATNNPGQNFPGQRIGGPINDPNKPKASFGLANHNMDPNQYVLKQQQNEENPYYPDSNMGKMYQDVKGFKDNFVVNGIVEKSIKTLMGKYHPENVIEEVSRQEDSYAGQGGDSYGSTPDYGLDKNPNSRVPYTGKMGISTEEGKLHAIGRNLGNVKDMDGADLKDGIKNGLDAVVRKGKAFYEVADLGIQGMWKKINGETNEVPQEATYNLALEHKKDAFGTDFHNIDTTYGGTKRLQ